MVKEILLIGDPRLYDVSEEVKKDEIESIKPIIDDLHDTLLAFRNKWGYGRAIAAPQIGALKRILYMNIDHAVPMINPVLTFPDDEMMEVLDDCMSFPNLFVRVMRYKRAVISYKNLEWEDCSMELEGDLSELLQHEYDHLDGILATMKAIDNKSFQMKR
ncbi:MAG: peptide deformylase [Clostridiaceae bacterium]